MQIIIIRGLIILVIKEFKNGVIPKIINKTMQKTTAVTLTCSFTPLPSVQRLLIVSFIYTSSNYSR